MDQAHVTATPPDLPVGGGEEQTFVTFLVAGHRLGVPADCVRDILVPERIARVPGAPAAVRGRIELRGRTATVIDMRARLELPVRGDARLGMGVTVEHRDELYMLLVDYIGDFVCPPPRVSDDTRSTLGAAWQGVTNGVYRSGDGLMAALDLDRLLDLA
jgi:purine-binding chemotaxis protein CheW